MGQPTWSADPSSIYHYTAEEVAEVEKDVIVEGDDWKKDAAALFKAEAWHGVYPDEDVRQQFLDCYDHQAEEYDSLDTIVGFISSDISFLVDPDF